MIRAENIKGLEIRFFRIQNKENLRTRNFFYHLHVLKQKLSQFVIIQQLDVFFFLYIETDCQAHITAK